MTAHQNNSDPYRIFKPEVCQKLTAEEESTLAAISKAGRIAEACNGPSETIAAGIEARQRLICSVIPWVIHLANKCDTIALDAETRIADALLGLVERIDKFDPKRGRLTTFVKPFVWRHLLRCSFEQNSGIKLPPAPTKFPQARELEAASWVIDNHLSIEHIDNRLDAEGQPAASELLAELLAKADLTTQMRIVVAEHLRGVPYRTIAKGLGTSYQRVQQIMSMALDRLRETAGLQEVPKRRLSSYPLRNLTRKPKKT